MSLRLLLVGMVASLGLTPPSVSELGMWGRAANQKVRATLSRWDALHPMDDTAFVLVMDDCDFSTLGIRNAAETECSLAEAVIKDAAPAPEIHPPVCSRVSSATPIQTGEGCCDSGGFDVTTKVVEVALSDAAFERAVGEFIAALPNAETPQGFTFHGSIAKATETAGDEDHVFNQVVGMMAVTFAQEQKGSTVAQVLLDSPDRSEAAFEEPKAETKVETRESRFSQAVRLTQEAVFAWASLLHGPAIVTVGP